MFVRTEISWFPWLLLRTQEDQLLFICKPKLLETCQALYVSPKSAAVNQNSFQSAHMYLINWRRLQNISSQLLPGVSTVETCCLDGGHAGRNNCWVGQTRAWLNDVKLILNQRIQTREMLNGSVRIVLDEAQWVWTILEREMGMKLLSIYFSHMKDPKTNQSCSFLQLKAQRKLCLTGTPLQYQLGDLQNLIKFLWLEPWTNNLTWKQCVKLPVQLTQWKKFY